MENITAQAVQKIIDQTKYGEYDQYHEWSPSYSLSDKTVFLENMLKDWERTEEEGKKLILQFAKDLLKEAGKWNSVIIEKLERYSQIPEIKEIYNHAGRKL
ncbi:MAG TPA: hypothetical protein DHW82_04835 [Spirochaetia bacterium]|nr:MAG: hypothetical protein A2Y41_12625 [Spirochaetes bacterium GWB1_36_13]HCL56318.1 hypothetical protein [Spirochaetia bacterium]